MPAPRRRLVAPEPQASWLRAGFDRIRDEHDVVPHDPATLAEAAAAARTPRLPDRDLTDVPFVTLDPVGSRDLDQAMQLSRRPGGGYRVRYAIADVAAFVSPGGLLDAAARSRASTVYCPDRREPLHPAELSEGAASLLPDGPRPAAVWTIDLGPDGGVRTADVARAMVRSRAQLDYTTEQARLDAGPDPDHPVAILAEIGALRRRLEIARGGVSLGRPEQEVIARGDGDPGWTLVVRAPRPVEEHNAQVSLLTGMVAAALMLDAGVGLLRTMPAAEPKDLARLRRQASALGVDWPAGTSYPELLHGLDRARPEVAAFLLAATRLFRGAAWTPFDGAPPPQPEHGAVAAPYAHVTAPLRRLVDRFGTEVCLAASADREPPDWVRAGLAGLGEAMARGAARASAVDRACTDLVEATVLAPHVGERFDAVALDDRTVQLCDPGVVARTDGEMASGTRVRVELTEARPATRTVRFRVVPGPPDVAP